MSAPILRSVSPILSTSNVDAAIAFYESFLNIWVTRKWGSPTSEGSVCREGVQLILELPSKANAPIPAKIYVVVLSLQDYYIKVVAAGAKVTYPLTEYDYGMKINFRKIKDDSPHLGP